MPAFPLMASLVVAFKKRIKGMYLTGGSAHHLLLKAAAAVTAKAK